MARERQGSAIDPDKINAATEALRQIREMNDNLDGAEHQHAGIVMLNLKQAAGLAVQFGLFSVAHSLSVRTPDSRDLACYEIDPDGLLWVTRPTIHDKRFLASDKEFIDVGPNALTALREAFERALPEE